VAATPAQPGTWATLGKLIAALVAAGVLVAGLLLPYAGGTGLAVGHEAGKFLDTTCSLTESQPPQKTTLYARDNKTVIATIFSQDRVPIPLDQVPQQLQDALVATEDRRFYSHHGVDMRGLIRSAVSTSSGDTQGGSTLTMQYVKQMRYYQAGKDLKKQQAAVEQNLNRKIEDAKCALYLENTKHESKATILDNYLNIAFFGENSYGIQTAAQTYFGKDAKNLTLPESALLVGLLRAPSEYDPFVNPSAAKDRRNQVIQNLVDVGKLAQADADKYKASPVSLSTTSPPPIKEGCANSGSRIANVGFFCDYVKSWLQSTGGISETQLETGGLRIVTTLDATIQDSAQANLVTAIPATSPMTAVLPVLDPRTGDVLAMATSKKYGNSVSAKDNTHTSLPIFTEYTGQGASTYKLFPLLTALQTGVPSGWPLRTPPNNAPYLPVNCATDAGVTNGDAAQESYGANETLQSATVKSSNTYFVGLADQLLGCNLRPIVDMATKLGMNSLNQPSGEGKLTVAQTILNFGRAQQLVLGDVASSPLEIAGAYAAVANEGTFNAPAPVLSITDSRGTQLPVKRSTGVPVVSAQVALQAIRILSGDTKAPGTSAAAFQAWYAQNQSTVAGKTGTSVAVANGVDTTKNASLWFVGMTPNLVAASALINFDHPNAAAAGLPGVADAGRDAYGAYASGVWLRALTPTLASQQWTWPDPGAISGGTPVPDIVGKDLATAKTMLTGAGFKMQQLDQASGTQCASGEPLNTVAYYGPQLATPGSTITVCPSAGQPQQVFVPPPAPVTTPTTAAGPRATKTPGGRTSHPGARPGPGPGH
jgi:membrane peptidoglycan carboxypeptidase